MGKGRCEGCIYSDVIYKTGRCRRYPPLVVGTKGLTKWNDPNSSGDILQTKFPEVDLKADWCGEFSPSGGKKEIGSW